MLVRRILKTSILTISLVLSFSYFNLFEWGVGGVEIKKDGLNVSKDEIIGTIDPLLEPGWLYLHLSSIKEALSELPWVEDVQVYRIFPDKIALNIKEKVAVARYGSDGLVSLSGRVFKPSNEYMSTDLPVLDAPNNDFKLVFSALLQLKQALLNNKDLPQNVSKLKYSPDTGWDVTFTNSLLVHLGRVDFTSAIGKFSYYYPKIVTRNKNKVIKTIDMRYANGAAVS
ncbi:MAG: FtsQ-type POTRA domain-containing protein [Legionellales bacterium]|nr:FtsQ-type POTRA domain-containing protein [Legionellales bacterium]